MRQLIASAPLMLALAGCTAPVAVPVKPATPSSKEVAFANNFLAESAKDPESVKIRRIKGYQTASGDRIICGEWDAKNSYGGYTGYSSFYFRLRENTLAVSHVDSSSNSLKIAAVACDQASNGSINIRPETEPN